jgi:hypothetical protein
MGLFNLSEDDIHFSDEEISKVKNAVKDLSDVLQIKEQHLLDAIDIGLKETLFKRENVFLTVFFKIKKRFIKTT